MSAAAVILESLRARSFEPITAPAPKSEPHAFRLKFVAMGTETAFLPAVAEDIAGEPIQVLTSEFPPVTHHTTIQFTPSVLHRLRHYSGAALLGALVCGLAFGWSEYSDLAQWIGAGVAVIAYAVADWRSR